jgi:hypothetical protein
VKRRGLRASEGVKRGRGAEGKRGIAVWAHKQTAGQPRGGGGMHARHHHQC